MVSLSQFIDIQDYKLVACKAKWKSLQLSRWPNVNQLIVSSKIKLLLKLIYRNPWESVIRSANQVHLKTQYLFILGKNLCHMGTHGGII
jgi:hypothetical protein